MRLLYFAAHQAWPLTSGNRLRDYHQARELAKRAAVTFVEMCHPGEGPSQLPSDSGFEELVSLKKGAGYTPHKIVRGMTGSTPLTTLNYFQPQAAAQLTELLARRNFSSAQVEGVHLSGYLPLIHSAVDRLAIVIDWHNIESELMWRYSENEPLWAKRIVARRTAALLERTETMLLEDYGAHTVASQREKQLLAARNPSAKVHVVPNGIDTASLSPRTQVEAHTEKNGGRPCILFVGSMDYHANADAVTWFVREAWPELAQRHPELEFVIVGRNPSAAVRELASSRIRVTGTVDDVGPYYRAAAAVVVPLRVGSGTRLKILEAMAAGVPIISTQLGAEGLDVQDNVHLLFADAPSDIVGALARVLNSPQLSSRLARASQDLVSRYDWANVGAELYRIHSGLARPASLSVAAG